MEWIAIVLGLVVIVGFILLRVFPPRDEATQPEPVCAHCEALEREMREMNNGL